MLAGSLVTQSTATNSAAAPSLSPFVPVGVLNKPVGIAVTASRLLVTDCGPNGSPEVLSVESRGGVTRPAFATLPGACGENYIAIAPGPANPQGVHGYPSPNAAGFPSNFLFVTGRIVPDAPAIFEVGLRGAVTRFATLPAASCPAFGGLTFDRAGSFRNRLVVVCAGGQVWLIGPVTRTADEGFADPVICPSAVCQLIATVPTTAGAVAGGPDIAPSTARLPGLPGGAILVPVKATHGPGSIFAVSPPPSGAVTELTTVAAPGSMAIIPRTMCSYAPWTASPESAPVYFAVDDASGTVGFLPVRAFAGRAAGGVLVTTGTDGITLLRSVNGKTALSPFAASGSGLHGSAFVDCAAPLLLRTVRRDSAIAPGGGLVSVWILQTPNFNPLTVCVGHGATAGGDTCPLIADPMQTPPTYGVTGTEASFAECGSSLMSTPQGPALECSFYRNRLGIRAPGTTGRPASRGAAATAAGFAPCVTGLTSARPSLAPGCALFGDLLALQPPSYTGRLILKLFYVGGPTGAAGGLGVTTGLGARPASVSNGPNVIGPHGNGQGSGSGQGSGEQGNKGVGHENGPGHGGGGGDGDAEGDD